MKIRNIDSNTTQKVVNILCTNGRTYTLSHEASVMFFNGDKAGLRELIRQIETQLKDVTDLTKNTADEVISVTSVATNYVSVGTLDTAYTKLMVLQREAIGLLLAIVAIDEFGIKMGEGGTGGDNTGGGTGGDTPTPSTPTPEPTPIYATSNDRLVLEEIIIDKNLGEYIIPLASQTETEPVYFDVPTSWNAQVTIWNPLTQQWVSTRMYSTSTVTHTIDGADVEYTRWTDNTESDAAATRARITWEA